MSLFTKKHAIESTSLHKQGKVSKRANRSAKDPSIRRVCRVEELEKREYLNADPISIGVVYTEQYTEDLGDKFYIAWVGGESGCTTLDSITINLDKNQNGSLDDGETYFDVSEKDPGVYSCVPFTVVDQTEDIGYAYEVEDGGMTLSISFTNFHQGDSFVFVIDLDESQSSASLISSDSAVVEGMEMGGSIVDGVAGSHICATFVSDHYKASTWTGDFIDAFDLESERPSILDKTYDSSVLPYDVGDGNEGISQAGAYGVVTPEPKSITISGYVYADYDVDCNYDDTDSPLYGVEVLLVDENGYERTTTTDVNGYYEFSDSELLPGVYNIFTEENFVSEEGYQYADFCAKGGTFGTKITPLNIEISGMQGGDVATDNNFAKVLPGSIEGYVFEDLNDKNNKELGEEWDGFDYPAKIELYRMDLGNDGNVVYTFIESQTVDENGHYEFKLDCSYNADGTARKLPGRAYEIREIFDSVDYSDGKDYVGSLGGQALNDTFTDVFVGYDEHGVNYNYGELKLGSIAGNVYEDRNANGVKEEAEPGIKSVTIELYRWNGAEYIPIATTTTDENGDYLFEDLDISCEYAVRELQPESYDDGTTNVGTIDGIEVGVAKENFTSQIEIGWDQHGINYNFGELKLGSIAGNVYEDRNNNGERDNDEKGIEDVVVELYQWNGTEYEYVAETHTDANGEYEFQELDINKLYAVRELQPEEYDNGKNSVGTLGGISGDDYIQSIDVQWDDRGYEYNFGELKLGSISGYVYEDLNDNGIKEIGEAGIAGVTVELYCLEDGSYVKIAETITNDEGFYKFDSLDIEQTYGIKEIQPESYTDGKESVGSLGGVVTDDFIHSVVVKWDDYGINYNYGELLLGSVSGYVYHDANDNGIKDPNEKGITNVSVELYQLDNGEYIKIAEVFTDKEGFYKFESLDIEQTYCVKEIQPENWISGKNTVGTLGGNLGEDDYIDSIPVKWDQHGEDYNFGELLPLSSLSGYVYEDNNNNGLKEVDEAGIVNVTVSLYLDNGDGTESLIDSVVTDENGFYQFTELLYDQTYIIRETQPVEYYDGKDTVGTIFGKTVGILGENDEFIDILVPIKGQGINYNFGELVPGSLSGYVYYDMNENGIKDENEPGIPSTTITLWVLNETSEEYEKTGDVVQTDGAGHYIFTDLEPCRIYQIVETQPVNYINGWNTIGSLGGELEGDVFTSVPVNPGDDGIDYNFGEIKRSSPNPPSHDPEVDVPNLLWSPSPTYYSYINNQPYIPGSQTTLFGGGGFISSNVLRLSVLNSGSARAQDIDEISVGFRELYGNSQNPYVTVSFNDDSIMDGMWYFYDLEGNNLSTDHDYLFGLEGAKPIVGDWNGDGRDHIGIFADGRWYLDRNGDGKWDAEDDLWAELGSSSDQPVSGDWDGDGKADIGIYGPQWSSDPIAVQLEAGLPDDLNHTVNVSRSKNVPPDEKFFQHLDPSELAIRHTQSHQGRNLRHDLVDHVFEYGTDKTRVLMGDWTGSGTTKPAYYEDGNWFFDMNGNGIVDDADLHIKGVGGKGYIPIAGDFNGDGIDTIGLFADGEWLLDIDGDRQLDSTVHCGQAGDFPVVGDWNGDGIDELGVYRERGSDTQDSSETTLTQTEPSSTSPSYSNMSVM